MSAFGPKRTSQVALHMSAFRGKADMPQWSCPLLRSLLGVKRTCPFAPHMSAYDPKRTSGLSAEWAIGCDLFPIRLPVVNCYCLLLRKAWSSRRAHATAQFHYHPSWRCGGVAAGGARAAERAHATH